jgi:hypothetical protein
MYILLRIILIQVPVLFLISTPKKYEVENFFRSNFFTQ